MTNTTLLQQTAELLVDVLDEFVGETVNINDVINGAFIHENMEGNVIMTGEIKARLFNNLEEVQEIRNSMLLTYVFNEDELTEYDSMNLHGYDNWDLVHYYEVNLLGDLYVEYHKVLRHCTSYLLTNCREWHNDDTDIELTQEFINDLIQDVTDLCNEQVSFKCEF